MERRTKNRKRLKLTHYLRREPAPRLPRSVVASNQGRRGHSMPCVVSASLVIFAGIIIRIPRAITNLIQLIRTDQFSLIQTVLFAGMAVVVVFFVARRFVIFVIVVAISA